MDEPRGCHVLAFEPVDVGALDPSAQSACAAAMARLLWSTEAPLQLLVRRRRVCGADPPGAVAGSVARRLDLAMRTHRRSQLQATAAFRNAVWLVVLDRDRRREVRQLALAAETLRAGGLRVITAAGDDRLRDGDAVRRGPTGPSERERRRWAVVGGVTWCGLELARLPGTPVSPGWLRPLVTAAAAFDLAIHLTPVDRAAASRDVERRLRTLHADRLLDLDRGRIGDAGVDVGVEAASDLRERFARNEVRPLRLTLTVAVRGDGVFDAEHGAAVVAAAAGGVGLGLRPTHLHHRGAVRATRAGAAPPARGKLVDSAAAATFLPLAETVCDDPHGYRLGVDRHGGAPIAIDVFDTAHHGNANVAVFAASGHGKSFALGALVLEAVAHGVGAVVIDPEGEHAGLMHAAGGEYLRVGAPGCGAINVFEVAARADESVAIGVALIDVLCGGVLTDVERARVDAVLHNAIGLAREQARPALLGDTLQGLERAAPRAAAVLRRVCNGPLGEIFNRQTSIRLDGELCAISLRELPHEFVAAATLLIAHWLWARVRGGRRRQHIVLDEVGALCAHPPLRELLVQLARRCRKHGASLVVATQNVEDLLRTEEGSVVATNCATVLLGGHRAAEARRMEAAFGLTERQGRFIEHAGRGEFLLLAGRRRCEVRIEVPALHRGVLTPG